MRSPATGATSLASVLFLFGFSVAVGEESMSAAHTSVGAHSGPDADDFPDFHAQEFDMEPSEGIIHEITAEGRSIVGDFIRNWRSRVETAVRKTFNGATDDVNDFDVGVRRPVFIPPMGHPMHQVRPPRLGRPGLGPHRGGGPRPRAPGYRNQNVGVAPSGGFTPIVNRGGGPSGQQAPADIYSTGPAPDHQFPSAQGNLRGQQWRPAAAIQVDVPLPEESQKFRPQSNQKPSKQQTTTTEAPFSVVTAPQWADRDETYSDYPVSSSDYSGDFEEYHPKKNSNRQDQKSSSPTEKKAQQQLKLSGFVGGGADEHVFDVGASLSFGGPAGIEGSSSQLEFTKGRVSDASPHRARGSSKLLPAPRNPEPAPPAYDGSKRSKTPANHSNKHNQQTTRAHAAKSSKPSNQNSRHHAQESTSTRARSDSHTLSPVYHGNNNMKGWNKKQPSQTTQQSQSRHSVSQKRQDTFSTTDEIAYWPEKVSVNRHTVSTKPVSAPKTDKPTLKLVPRGQISSAKNPEKTATSNSKHNKRPWTPSQVMYSRNFTQHSHSYPEQTTDYPTAATADYYDYGSDSSAPQRTNSYSPQKYYDRTKTFKYHQSENFQEKENSPVRKFLKIVKSSLQSEGFQVPSRDLLTVSRIPLGAVSDMVQIIAALRTSMDPSMDAFLRGTFTDATEKISGYLKHLVPFDLPSSYFLHGKFLMDRLSNLTTYFSHSYPSSWNRAKNVLSFKMQQENKSTTADMATTYTATESTSTTEDMTSNEVPTARRRSKRSPQDVPEQISDVSPTYYGWYQEYLKEESPSKRRRDAETCSSYGYDYYNQALTKAPKKPQPFEMNELGFDQNFGNFGVDPGYYTPDRVQIVPSNQQSTSGGKKKKNKKQKKKKKKSQNKNANYPIESWGDSGESYRKNMKQGGGKKNKNKTPLKRDDALYVDDYIDYSDLSLLPNTYEKTRRKPVPVEEQEYDSPRGPPGAGGQKPGSEDYAYYYYYDDEDSSGKKAEKNSPYRQDDEDPQQRPNEEYDEGGYEDEPEPARKRKPKKNKKKQIAKPAPNDEEYYDYYYDDDSGNNNQGRGNGNRPQYEDDEYDGENHEDPASKKSQPSRFRRWFSRSEDRSKDAGRSKKKQADSRKDPWYKSLRMPRIGVPSLPKPDFSVFKRLDPRSVMASIKRQDPFVTFGGLSFGAFIAALMYSVMSDIDPGIFSQSKLSELGHFDIAKVYDRMTDLLARDPSLRAKRSYDGGKKGGNRKRKQKQVTAGFRQEEEGILLDEPPSPVVNDEARTELRCAMDSLWTAYEDDPLTKQCLRLALCQSINEAPAVRDDKNYSMRVLLLTTFSWMLGDQESFQFANDVEDQVIRRTGFSCTELAPLCKAAKKKYAADMIKK